MFGFALLFRTYRANGYSRRRAVKATWQNRWAWKHMRPARTWAEAVEATHAYHAWER